MSQSTDILTYLEQGNHLTPLEALQMFGCLSLSQRITGLRKQGHDIVTLPYHTQSGKRVGMYVLASVLKAQREEQVEAAFDWAERVLK